MEIKPFEESYIETLASLMLALQSEDTEELPSTKELLIAKIQKSLSQQNLLRSFVVFENEIAIGYFVVAFSYSFEFGGKLLELDEMYITKEFRKKGYAKNILDFCEKFGKENDCVCLYFVTTIGNVYARELYRKYGFSDVQRFFHYKDIY